MKQTGAAADVFTWTTGSSDVRALQNPASPGPTGRAAFTWYSNTAGTPQWAELLIAIGSTPRDISIYMIDWDGTTRAQTVDIIDTDTSAILDTRTIAAGTTFHAGIWMRWRCTGNITIRATKTGLQNPVISAILFDTPAAAGSGWWMM